MTSNNFYGYNGDTPTDMLFRQQYQLAVRQPMFGYPPDYMGMLTGAMQCAQDQTISQKDKPISPAS